MSAELGRAPVLDQASAGDPVPTTPRGSSAPSRRPRPLAARQGRHLPVAAYALLVVVVFSGVIGASAAAGAWQTSGRTTAGGQAVTLQGASTTEIKGWMTVGDVAAAFDVPLAEILAAFELPADTPPGTALKDLESDLFSVTALRDWIDLRGAAGS